MSRDSAGRWYPTHEITEKYCTGYRSPSRAWPHSYAKAVLTTKFAKWAATEHPDFAKQMGILN
jgi:hypothetical protein